LILILKCTIGSLGFMKKARTGRAGVEIDADLSSAVADLQSEGPGGISLVKDLAFNATAHATGASHGVVPLGRLQRVWAALI
jgi:hypothetical protein